MRSPGRKGKIIRNLRVLLLAVAMVGVMSGLVVYAPTFYRMFCALTGFGGTLQQVALPQDGKAAGTADAGRPVTVSFDANVAPGLPWAFEPAQWQVEARLGEPVEMRYRARNLSDETIVARATFNVTPYKAAPYFFKIECFCFTDERLGPGEAAEMPLVLYVDRQLQKDPETRDVTEITLSYTFFRQDGLSPEEIAAARDLAGGSAQLDRQLQRQGRVEVENDAPRQ